MKTYGLQFGGGDPRTYTGLSPTFLYFVNMTTGATVAPPSITELFANTGVYKFQWGTTTPIAFLADAATTSPGTSGRYVVGQLDPNDRSDEYGTTLVAIGTTNFALGTTSVALGTTNVAIGTTLVALSTSILAGQSFYVGAIGTTASSFGNSSTDPVDLFGYLKRIQENLEGNNTYSKVTGAFTILSRGSSYTLASKTVANSVSLVTKT